LTALEVNYRTVQEAGANTNLTNKDYFWAGSWAKAIVRYLLDGKRAVVFTTQPASAIPITLIRVPGVFCKARLRTEQASA
jgi:hypothetical protein